MNGHVRPPPADADWPWHWVRDKNGAEKLWTRVKKGSGQHGWYWIEPDGDANGYYYCDNPDEAAYAEGYRYIAPCCVMDGQPEMDVKYTTEPWRCN